MGYSVFGEDPKSVCRGQSVVALSSGEAEFHALLTAASEARRTVDSQGMGYQAGYPTLVRCDGRCCYELATWIRSSVTYPHCLFMGKVLCDGRIDSFGQEAYIRKSIRHLDETSFSCFIGDNDGADWIQIQSWQI